MMGDLNAKVDFDKTSLETGVGDGIDNGERFVAFYNIHHLIIGVTLFEHRVCHKVNWVSVDWPHSSYQIDYMAINSRLKRCLLDVRNKGGTDIGFEQDHYPFAYGIRNFLQGWEALTFKIEKVRLRNPPLVPQ